MLKLIRERIDLGNIKLGQSTTFFADVKNDGDSDILVTSIQPGCGSCTTASMANPLVSVGKTEKVKIVFTPNSVGEQSKRVTLNSSLIIFFRANVGY